MDLSSHAPHDIRDIFAEATNNFRRDGGIADLFTSEAVFPRDMELNGQTSFFRHQGVVRAIIQSWNELAIPGPVNVLAAPSSIGCEAYGFSAQALGKLGGNAGFKIDAFDKSSLFTRLARVQAYPQEMYQPLETQWRDILFDEPKPRDPLVSVRADVAAPVRFLKPQAFEYFKPRQTYDIVMVNNLFMYMQDDQVADSLDVIARTGARLVVMTSQKQADIVSTGSLPYMSVEDHPAWKDTTIARVKGLHREYSIWGRMP